MSSIVNAVLTGALSLLVKEGRHRLAEKLKDSDATDQKLRSWIIEEFDNVYVKLDAMARSDLGASISFFKEGMVFLNKALDCEANVDTSTSAPSAQMESKEKKMKSPLKETKLSSAGVNTTSLVEQLRKIDVTKLDKSGKVALRDAKKRFDDARRKATEAFNNEDLTPSDRILATGMRLMATILEKAENPSDSLAACRSGLEELHLTPFVRENFKAELTGGVKAKFQTDERRQIISSVCQVNRIIYGVFVILGEKQMLFLWPCLQIGNEEVDPLRDSRVAKTLRKLDMGDCCVAWSFGHEGQKRLKSATSLATNSTGEFLVADSDDCCIKVFDAKGTFLDSFDLPAEAKASVGNDVTAVATDRDDNIYILVNGHNVVYICVLNNQAKFSHSFKVQSSFRAAKRVMVKDDHLFVQGRPGLSPTFLQEYVAVCKRDGTYIGDISEQTLARFQDITAVDDGRIMVLALDSVYVYADVTADHDVDDLFFRRVSRFLRKFPVVPDAKAITFHWATGHVIIASQTSQRSQVLLYSKDGDFERGIDIALGKRDLITAATVTTDGRICVLVSTHSSEDCDCTSKVFVL